MAQTIYKTPSVTGSPERLAAAMEDVRLIGEALEAGTGDFAGIEVLSFIKGDDGVFTWTFNQPIPDIQLPQFSFA